MPKNPTTGKGGRIGDIVIILETLQIMVDILLSILIARKKRG